MNGWQQSASLMYMNKYFPVETNWWRFRRTQTLDESGGSKLRFLCLKDKAEEGESHPGNGC